MKDDNSLGVFLMSRRKRLDPAAFGFSGRRRTPGLRREEVAQRANISTTWYTWLEQGRGGAPSVRVLESLSEALMLTESEREHLFLIAIGHSPQASVDLYEGITARLQRFLDDLALIPAIIVTPQWDVIAWNYAACMTLSDYSTLSTNDRNILRRIFLDDDVRHIQEDWDSVARYVVATFRAEVIRAGENDRAVALINELSAKSAEFSMMWADNDVRTTGEGIKKIQHPSQGDIVLEFSSFSVDGRPDLRMLIYNPASTDDLAKVQALCK